MQGELTPTVASARANKLLGLELAALNHLWTYWAFHSPVCRCLAAIP